MVSHCKTESKREQIVSHLREVNENLNIDIFGKCGDKEHKLPGQTTNDIAQTMKMRADLYVDKLKDYKFYLAFENSDCSEYITEKFFFALKFGLLPIAMGGLSREDYEKVAPPHSYLHVKDYDSPESLMKKLEIISKDETLFNSYFWWREFYTIEKKIFKENSHCQLCQMLNERPDFKSKNDYSHLIEYWNKCND